MSVRFPAMALAVLAACGLTGPTGRAQAPADTARAGPAGLSLMQQRLLEAANIALPPGVAPESLPDPRAPGARVLRDYCTQCHALPSPAMHGAVDWPAVTRRMWLRIDMMAGGLGIKTPSTAQRAQLLSYLQSHAVPVAARLPAGLGRELFEAVCSRCHVLADPRVHTPPDWAVVVTRMEVNMEKMKMRRISRAETAQILTYLQTVSAPARSR